MNSLIRLTVVAAPVLLAGRAEADEFDVENFHATSPGDARLFGVQSTAQAAPGELAVGVTLGMVNDPLVVVDRTDRVADVIHDRFGIELAGAYGVGPVEARIALPMVVSQNGDTNMRAGLTGVEGGGTGDLRLGARMRLLRAGRLTLSGDLSATLPTSTHTDFGGDAMPTATPMLIATLQDDRVLVAANAGGRFRESRIVGDLEVGNAFVYGAGVAIEAMRQVAIVGELGGEVAGTDRNQTPLELRGGLRWTGPNGITAAAAYGRGLIDGYGAPDHRVLVSLTWRKQTRAMPLMVAQAVPPPIQPPPNPDPDHDGILGANDKCPNEPEDFDGFEDTDGCPEPDNDHDNIPDAIDKCPLAPEDFDGFADDDGCPDPDNDFDGIPDKDDRCPNQPEVINGVDDDDGCPDEGKRLVVIGETKIEIREMIYFANDRAEILPRSQPVIDQLAKTLQRNPWIKQVRVEGHTDDRGDDAYNKALSQRRAESVTAALAALGVAADRLVAQGFGEEQPIDTNKTVIGRANNRRVEFHIVAKDEPPPGWRDQWSGGKP